MDRSGEKIGRIKLKEGTPNSQITRLANYLEKKELFLAVDMEHNAIVVIDIEEAEKLLRVKT